MSTGQPDRSFSFENTPRPADAQPPRSDDSVHRWLLDEVLEQTFSQPGEQSGPGAALMNSLVEVARQYRGQPLSIDPVLVRVVQSLLQQQFVAWRISPEQQARVTKHIATTLYDDPGAHERLEVFWNRLVSEA